MHVALGHTRGPVHSVCPELRRAPCSAGSPVHVALPQPDHGAFHGGTFHHVHVFHIHAVNVKQT